MENKVWKQRELVETLEECRREKMWEEASEWDRARLAGVAAPPAGVWVGVVPSRALDFQLFK